MLKRIAALILTVIMTWLSFECVCFDPFKEASGMILEVTEKSKARFDGLGTEWDPMTLAAENTGDSYLSEENRVTEEDFRMICDRVREMGLDKIRMFINPTWIEPVNDNDDPYTVKRDAFVWTESHIVSFFRILDLCEELGMKVNVTGWGGTPRNLPEYSETFCVLFDEIVNVRGYTCVNEFTPFNEPCWGYKDGDGHVDMESYYELCYVIDDMLREKNLRKKIMLNLSDCNYSDDSYDCIHRLKGLAEIYNTHSYDYLPVFSDTTMVDMSRILSKAAEQYGAIHTIGEFGPDTCIDSHHSSDTDTYSRGLLICRIVVNYMNGGSAGLNYWCLFDQMYYGGKMCVGLWRFKDEGWTARPMFYSYSLLTKYTEPGAEIYPILLDESHLCAIALKNPDKTWTYVVINSSKTDEEISFINRNFRNDIMDKYVYSEDSLPGDNHLIGSCGQVTVKDGLLKDTVKSNTMVVYHTAEDK